MKQPLGDQPITNSWETEARRPTRLQPTRSLAFELRARLRRRTASLENAAGRYRNVSAEPWIPRGLRRRA